MHNSAVHGKSRHFDDQFIAFSQEINHFTNRNLVRRQNILIFVVSNDCRKYDFNFWR